MACVHKAGDFVARGYNFPSLSGYGARKLKRSVDSNACNLITRVEPDGVREPRQQLVIMIQRVVC